MDLKVNLSVPSKAKAMGGEFFPSVLRYYTEDYRQNAFGMGGPTDVVEKLTGRPAEDFETIARRYATELLEARRTFGNKLKAILGFMKILLVQPYNVGGLERKWEIPKLSTTRFASEDQTWRRSHDLDNAYGVDRVGAVTNISEPRLAVL